MSAMRSVVGLAVVLGLTVSAAVADILPPPDRGPRVASVAGLTFALRDVSVRMPPGYTKTFKFAVLAGCREGTRNCALAHSRNLIGMEVVSVDGQELRPDLGRVGQILRAFTHAGGAGTVALALCTTAWNSQPFTVTFFGK